MASLNTLVSRACPARDPVTSVEVCLEQHNILSIDVEDWQPLADEWVYGIRTGPSGRIPVQIDCIRRILDRYGVRATFFWLGETAAAYPSAIRALTRDGHEIASHGHSHLPLKVLDPEAFELEILRSQDAIASACGQVPCGFRAPQFSISQTTWWGLHILAKHGFRYDSSIFPIRHRRYGMPGFRRAICRIETPYGPIVELPLSTVSFWGLRLPVAGGGYFRFLPTRLLLYAIARVNQEHLPFVSYFHPYEFDPCELAPSSRPSGCVRRARVWLFTLMQNSGRARMPAKLQAVLATWRFDSCINLLKNAGLMLWLALITGTESPLSLIAFTILDIDSAIV